MLKHTFLACMLFLLGNTLSAQSLVEKAKADKEPILEEVDQLAVYPGGNEALLNYLKTNMKYPQYAKDQGVQGTVVLKFLVEKNGKITLINPTENPSDALLEESVRLLRRMPNWEPGQKDGQVVRSWRTISIPFALN